MQTNIILNGDCISVMKTLPDNSVDAIVTDPPAGISFMGKDWDDKGSLLGFQEFTYQWSKEALRVLKPGGHALVWAIPRTSHHTAMGLERAGFEIRDVIHHIFGSGFPKSLNIGKQIDKMQGNEREDLGLSKFSQPAKSGHHAGLTDTHIDFQENKERFTPRESKGNSKYEGFGTALKPAVENWILCRKPLSEKNVATNVLKWGTGGINIDGCRIEAEPELAKNWDRKSPCGFRDGEHTLYGKGELKENIKSYAPIQGRFPANIILDEEAGALLDEQSGKVEGKDNFKHSAVSIFGSKTKLNTYNGQSKSTWAGASRFFYVAKASKSERNAGCEDMEDKIGGGLMATVTGDSRTGNITIQKNNHPTVKPIKLMQYLVRLVTPKGGIVLDPFLGSGTTAIACVKENCKFIGIEKEAEYVKIAKARLKPYLEQQILGGVL